MGGLLLRQNDLIGAINMYNKTLALKPDDAWAYHFRGFIYHMLMDFKLKFEGRVVDGNRVATDWNMCVYLARETGRLEEMPALIKFFRACPRTILAIRDYSAANPGEPARAAFEEAGRALADFTALLRWHERVIPDRRTVLGMKAILYFYMGGVVPSFIVFDEEMKEYALSSRELYYYALVAMKMNWKVDAILSRAIDEIEGKEDKEAEDFYYLGHLYLRRGEREKAIETFKRRDDFIFSAIMLACLSGDKAYRKRVKKFKPGECYDLSTRIDTSCRDLSRFQYFFHLRECASGIASFSKRIVRGLVPAEYKSPFWEVFRLPDGEKLIEG
jgi:tetratricopeptide (TPR) repeat protein